MKLSCPVIHILLERVQSVLYSMMEIAIIMDCVEDISKHYDDLIEMGLG